MQERILDIFEKLKSIMTVSGYECINAEAVRKCALEACGGFFDSSEITPLGSVILYHKSEKKDAKTLLLDAHIDTVGLVVSEICEGGFVRTVPCGGIDRRILTTAEVEIFGKRKIRGLFASVPPHLASKNGEDTLPDHADFLIDTGLSDDELKNTVSVGNPCTFIGKTARFLNARIASAHLDDKICCAAILDALAELLGKKPDCNVTVLLSSGEETRGGGAQCASYVTSADGAVALDVNFAKDKETPEYQSSRLGDGAMISYSAVTDRRMTDIVAKCAKSAGIKHKIIAEVEGTGTNADMIEVSNMGTPCAVLSVPVLYMHTPGEVCSLCDAQAVSDILVQVIENFDRMSREKDTLLGVRVLKGGDNL